MDQQNATASTILQQYKCIESTLVFGDSYHLSHLHFAGHFVDFLISPHQVGVPYSFQFDMCLVKAIVKHINFFNVVVIVVVCFWPSPVYSLFRT